MPGLTMPLLSTQIALTGTIWNPSNWVTIQPFVRPFNTARGRQHELQRPEAGQLTLTLYNGDGRFSPWNTHSPYYNLLSKTDSAFLTSVGTWMGTFACSPSFFGYATALYGGNVLKLTGTSSAVCTATTARYPVTGGRTYTITLSVRAGGAYSENARVAVTWLDAGGTQVGSAITPTRLAGHTAWIALKLVAKAPASAAFAVIGLTWVCTSIGRSTLVDCAGLFDTTSANNLAAVSQGWCLGQTKPLRPAQPVRIVAQWEGVTYPVFTGAISSWVPKYGTTIATQVFTAYDSMHLLALAPCTASTYRLQVKQDGAQVQWYLDDPPGTTNSVLDSSGHTRHGVATGSVVFGQPGGLANVVDTAALLPISSFAQVYCLTPPSSVAAIECLFKIPKDTPSTSFVDLMRCSGFILTCWGNTGTTIPRGSLVTPLSSGGWAQLSAGGLMDTAFHHVIMQKNGTLIQCFLDGTLVYSASISPRISTSLGIGTPTGLGGGNAATVDEFAAYSAPLSAAQALSHYQAFANGLSTALSGVQIRDILTVSGIPASAIGTIATGTVVCQAPSVTAGQSQLLPTIQTVENTEQGFFYADEEGLLQFLDGEYVMSNPAAITSNGYFASDDTPTHFHYLAGLVPGLDDLTLWNYIPVAPQNGATFLAETRTSQEENSLRMLTGYTGMLQATPGDAQALATRLKIVYGQPTTRVRSITLDSTATTGKNLPQMLGRKLLDRITVEWQPTDGTDSPFIQEANIEKITHNVTKTVWTTTWQLTPAPIPWFVLTHPVYGVLTGPPVLAA